MKHPLYKSISGRFLIITLILILLVGIGTSALSYQMFSKNLKNNLIHSAETTLQIFTRQIDTSLNEIRYLTDWCRTNSETTKFVMTPKSASSYNRITSSAADRLDEEFRYNHSGKYIYRLVIAGMDRKDYLQVMASTFYSVDRPIPAIIQSLPYFETLLNAHDYDFGIGFKEDPFLASRPQMLPVIRPVYHPYRTHAVGFIYVEISTELFTSVTAEYARQENTDIFLTAGSLTYAISPDEITLTDELDHLDECGIEAPLNRDTTVRKSSTGSSRYYITVPLEASGCSLTLPIPDNAFREHLRGYYRMLAVIFLLISIVGASLILVLSRIVTRPVRLIRTRLTSIAGGDFSKDAQIEWDNEFGEIGRTVNQLAVDIEGLIDSKIEYEKQQKDYEYQVLQSQINPHFLYNTLNSMKWMAAAQNAPGIAEMATALSHLLKNISKGTSTIVTIQDEITLLNDYFTIQKYRYGGAITLEYQIDDPALLESSTLRFTLQPIVENAIFHGIEPKGQAGHITVHIYKPAEDKVRIDITDNGVGMAPETIEKILNGDTAERSHFFKQLGISSVNRQIKYTFGEEYGLTIESEPGSYTRMSILLPYQI